MKTQYRDKYSRRRGAVFTSLAAIFFAGVIVGATASAVIIKAIADKPDAVDSLSEHHASVEQAEQEKEEEYISLGEFKLTAYCPCKKCCGKWAENRPIGKDGKEIVYTASGAIAEPGKTVAADTSILPFGKKVYIDGHEYTVQDTGGAIKGNRIDVYFADHQEALKFGVQYKEVFILEED